MGSSGSKRGSRFDSLDLDQSFDEPVEKRSTSRKVVKKGKDEDDLTTAEFVRRATKAYEEAQVAHLEWLREEEDRLDEDIFDFPKDPERWTAEDLQEHWTVGPLGNGKFGWDPVFATKDDWAIAMNEVKAGRRSPVAPYYLPFYKNDPVIPEEEFDIANPKSLIEELDRIEEFLTWESYVFKDGSSYEGTVWDDMATGKGVFATRNGLVRYEGEWLQNNMEGHGVVEVDIPDIEPRPGSKLEAKMRAEGKIIKRDYMSPADQKWLAMDIEESIWLTRRRRLFRIPFYERSEWIKVFGKKPEKGRYKYAGQWKHGRMHGCGVYEVNTRIIYGRFYFGEYLNDSLGCDADISALHAGIAEVAAAKARMFVNKPDGMVREERGPYGDPQHPYFYEEEDVWMAPGFINQFYETPDYWKTYVEEVDKEREMWLNSFYKSPLRIPMPAELEYWWEKYESPEFLVLNKEPEPDPEDPSKLVYTEDPLILHIPSGKLIDCADDENDGIRLFWKQELNDEDEDEDSDVDKREFLPLGFDEFYGRAKRIVERKEFWLVSFLAWFKKAIKPKLEQLEKWTDEKKKDCEEKLELVDLERELVESEMRYEEEMEEFEADVKDNQKEEEKNTLLVRLDESVFNISGKADFNEEEEDEEETTSSFGIASTKNSEKESSKDDKEGRQSGTSSFSSLSMSFCTFASVSQVPKKILGSFLPRNQGSGPSATRLPSSYPDLFQVGHAANAGSISYPRKLGQSASLRVAKNKCRRPYTHVQNNLARLVSADGTVLKRSNSQNDSWHADRGFWNMSDLERNPLCVLSLHVPLGSPQLRRPNMPL